MDAEPRESWLARLGRWTVYALLVAGFLVCLAIVRPNDFWESLAYGLGTAGALYYVQAAIVEPIQRQIRQLDQKIERLGKLIAYYHRD